MHNSWLKTRWTWLVLLNMLRREQTSNCAWIEWCRWTWLRCFFFVYVFTYLQDIICAFSLIRPFLRGAVLWEPFKCESLNLFLWVALRGVWTMCDICVFPWESSDGVFFRYGGLVTLTANARGPCSTGSSAFAAENLKLILIFPFVAVCSIPIYRLR